MLAQNERFQAQKKLAIVVTGLEGISFSAHTTDEFSAFEETWVKPQSIGRIVQSLSICIWGNVHYLALYQQMVEWLGLYNLSLNARDNTKVGQVPLTRINGFFIYWEEADNGTGRWDCPLLQLRRSVLSIFVCMTCVFRTTWWNGEWRSKSIFLSLLGMDLHFSTAGSIEEVSQSQRKFSALLLPDKSFLLQQSKGKVQAIGLESLQLSLVTVIYLLLINYKTV